MIKQLAAVAGIFAIGSAIAEENCRPVSPDHELLWQADAWLNDTVEVLDTVILEHCGEVVFERYYNGFDAETAHDMQSSTKTFTGLLTGIAIDRGMIKSIDQPIAELLPKQRDLLEGEKARITVRHLLEMTTGLKWVDFGAERSFDRQARAADSAAFILGEPLVSSPGETYFYNTGSSHLLSAIIHNNVAGTTAQFAEKFLFGPLGFEGVVWNRHGDGVNEGGWQLYLRPIDALKFGRLLLNRGQWEGEQLVSAAFIDAATSYLHQTEFGGAGYGYQMWHVPDLGSNDLAGARGWGGQNILVAADLNAVIVTNGDILQNPQVSQTVERLLGEFLIPALQGAP